MDLPALHSFALQLADVADQISLRGFEASLQVSRKADGSPVTQADRDVEAALRARIDVRYPDHAVLGEESGGALDLGRPTWVIDPIDATRNFVRGIPVFATLIGLVAGGRTVVGVASAPALGQRWDAAAGAGARRNSEAIRVSDVDDLSAAHILHGGLDALRRGGAWTTLGAFADQAWRTRGFGDFWMHLLVADGRAEAAFECDVKIWDVAALEVIVSEAGGRMTRFNGESALHGGDVLSANAQLHEPVRARLAAGA